MIKNCPESQYPTEAAGRYTEATQVSAKNLPVSRLIVEHATRLTNRLYKLEEYTADRLIPVMRITEPKCQTNVKNIDPPHFPPLFNELRDILQNAEDIVGRLEELVRATEL